MYHKHRFITQWSIKHYARGKYNCDQCGAEIFPTQPYTRRVFAYRSTLEVFREHSTACYDKYN
jgi:hypothetical protein